MEFFEHDAGEVKLHCAATGPRDAPLVICLHGFPEYWIAWAHVMDRLSDTFRLVAPDQRGFNLSSRPAGVDAYRAGRMAADLDSLGARLSPNRPFVLAGHDWGASIAYAYAIAHPARVSRLVIANGVHPACFQRAILDDEEQRAASQYINRLRAPEADEAMVENGFRRTLKMIEGFSRTDWMSDSVRAGYLEAWSRPGAMTAMLNWYRASRIVVPAPGDPAPDCPILSMPPDALKVAMPHLVLWGEADEALRPACLEGLGEFAPDLTVHRYADAGHWILHEKPKQVADAMRDFIAGG